MFGTCLYLHPLPSNNLSPSGANEELPLDLSCKPREYCSVPETKSPTIFLQVKGSRHQQNIDDKEKERDLACRSTPSNKRLLQKAEVSINKKETVGCDTTRRTESPTDSVYDTDSDVDIHREEETCIKDVGLSGNDSLVLASLTEIQSQSTPKRNRERTLLPCQVCGKAFDRPSLLKRHIRTHTGEKPHVCDVCGKGFSTSSSLNTHRRIHSGEKPHECPICGKRFTASSNLYYHRMTHVKEKPHKCTMCNKSFPTPGDLKSHMYVHNGSWPFQCNVCKRGFSKQTNLRNHLFLHTGKKPHNCSQCGKCFALACNLRAHMRTHSESGSSCLPISSADPAGNVSASEEASINSEPSMAPRPEEERLIIPPRLADHVFFWHTIQQQLATNIFVHQQQQQQQQQMNPLHFMSSRLTHQLKLPK